MSLLHLKGNNDIPEPVRRLEEDSSGAAQQPPDEVAAASIITRQESDSAPAEESERSTEGLEEIGESISAMRASYLER